MLIKWLLKYFKNFRDTGRRNATRKNDSLTSMKMLMNFGHCGVISSFLKKGNSITYQRRLNSFSLKVKSKCFWLKIVKPLELMIPVEAEKL